MALVWAVFLAAALQAPTPEYMTRMVVRLTGPGIKPRTFSALPKTIYEAAPHYARIEDPPDARQQIQKLVIVSEPDAYNVNLIDHKGTHAKDQGAAAKNELHLPIVLPFDPKHRLGILDRLEFGEEVEFFTQTGAGKKPGPGVNSQPTEQLILKTPLGPAILTVRGEKQTPVFLSWPAPDGIYKYEYIEYQDVPFKPELFAKPAGITWKELKPDGQPEPG